MWLVSIIDTARLALVQYRFFEGVVPASPRGDGGDFWGFLNAARRIAAGHSPYDFALVHQGYGYLYTPLVAVVLLPFHAAATENVWHVWTALSVLALVALGALVTIVAAPKMSDWRRPVFFSFTMITTFHFGPMVLDLSNGQTDAFVLLVFAATVLALERDWRASSGVLLGVGAVLKTWPGAAAVVLIRRGYDGRRRTFIGFLVILLVGPLLALVVGGLSGLEDLIKITFDARSQHQLSYSAWNVPQLLFSSTGLARPVVVSSLLGGVSSFVLVAAVGGLLGATLYWGDSEILSFWNVVGCVVLLLPASHLDYAMYLLPIFWIWGGRILATPKLWGRSFIIGGILGIWWLLLYRSYGGGLPTASSIRASLPFFVNLGAVAVSVLGDHFIKVDESGDSGSRSNVRNPGRV